MTSEQGEAQAVVVVPRGRLMQLTIVALLMIGEGVGVFLITRALNREPAPAVAAPVDGQTDGGTSGRPGDLVEIELAECKPNNRVTGKLITFQLRVSALAAPAQQQETERLVKEKQERIRDRINFVLRSAEPTHLAEPGLETIKRRIKHELDQLLGDERLIREVLIPEFLQSGSGV